MIHITPMRPNLTYQDHFDGALELELVSEEELSE
jgi:hypothetical protein